MSHFASTWAWEQKVANPRHKLLLVKLADSANDDGVCWPSLRTLSKHTGISKSALGRAVRALEQAGLVSIQETIRQDGSRGTHVYHLPLDGVSRLGGTGVSPLSGTGVSRPGRDAEPSKEPSVEPRPRAARAAPSPPEHLGGRRWRIPSARRTQGFEVDLGSVVLDGEKLPESARNRVEGLTCTCENRHESVCRHQRAAARAESRMERARQRDLRDAIFDALSEQFGAPASRQKAAYGAAVATLRERMVGEGVAEQPEAYAAEVGRRYGALVADWGLGRVTLNSFVTNWSLAGKLADGVAGVRSGNDNADDGFDAYNR